MTFSSCHLLLDTPHTCVLPTRVISGSLHYLPLPLTARMVQHLPSGWVTFWVPTLPSSPTQEIQWPSVRHLIYMFCLYANHTVSLVAHKPVQGAMGHQPLLLGCRELQGATEGYMQCLGCAEGNGIISSVGDQERDCPSPSPKAFSQPSPRMHLEPYFPGDR